MFLKSGWGNEIFINPAVVHVASLLLRILVLYIVIQLRTNLEVCNATADAIKSPAGLNKPFLFLHFIFSFLRFIAIIIVQPLTVFHLYSIKKNKT
jgi:hypothetical protein